MIGEFVTAKLKGKDNCRQGAVISVDPLIISGQSGTEYECEGEPRLVINPPDICIGCDLPLGSLCAKCEEALGVLEKTLTKAGLKLTKIASA